MEAGPSWIGWLSSIVLLVTILAQIHKQYKSQTAEGVSWFLFSGQLFASGGFITYSVMTGDLVFIVTNCLLFVSHLIGLWLTFHLKTKRSSRVTPTSK